MRAFNIVVRKLEADHTEIPFVLGSGAALTVTRRQGYRWLASLPLFISLFLLFEVTNPIPDGQLESSRFLP
jgi:hypothetical protein